jgi:hypothetical protein
VEGLLSELQVLAASAICQRVPVQQQQQQQRRQSPDRGQPVPAATTGKLLSRVASQISGMSTRSGGGGRGCGWSA